MLLTYRNVDLGSYGIIQSLEGLHSSAEERDLSLDAVGRHGKLFRRGILEPRRIVVGMVVSADSWEGLEQKLSGLRSLQHLGPAPLYYKEGNVERNCSAELLEVSVSLSRVPTARAVLEFYVPEAYVLGTSLTTVNISVDSSPKTVAVNHGGTAVATWMTIRLSGTLKNPRIDNLSRGIWLGIMREIAAQAYIVVDSRNFTVKDQSGNSVLPNFAHAGSTYFFELSPGSNQIQISSETLGGSVRFEFYPHY